MGKAKAWDAARDQQLFLLIIGSVKVDYNVVAQKWAEKYRKSTSPAMPFNEPAQN